jgi:predicted  nucleic acid-binding Zn-ribbon protein
VSDFYCTECGVGLRSRVAGFVPASCTKCGSGKVKLTPMEQRELNAPQEIPLPTPIDASVAVDNLTESDQHRKRTVVGVDTGKVEAERLIALEERRGRWERRALWGGAVCGYTALIVEIWRMAWTF